MMFLRLSFLFFIFISFQSVAEIEVPDSVRDQIVSEVIADTGYFDAAEVEIRVRLWKLAQPQPKASGELIDSGNCVGDCELTGGDSSLPMPRKVKFKGKIKDGNITQNLIIKWKRPQALPENSSLRIKKYKVIVSKDGSTFEKYKVKAKYKNNGKPQKHQKLKLRGLDSGDYKVQVKAIYETINNDTASNKTTTNKEASQSSEWSGPSSQSLEKDTSTVGGLPDSALKTCLLLDDANTPNEVVDNDTHLSDITDIKCIDKGLVDSDLALLESFDGLMVLNLKKNVGLTNIEPLGNLPQLTWLSLNYNSSIDLTPFNTEILYNIDNFPSLESLYLVGHELTQIPTFPDTVTWLNLSRNKIIDNTGGYWPSSPLKALILSKNNTAFDSNGSPVGDSTLNDNFFENFAVMSDGNVETIQARKSAINNIDAFKSYEQLKNLDLLAHEFNETLDFSTYNGKGLCTLRLESESVKTVTGVIPLRVLSVINSDILESLSLTADTMDITGTNALRCTHHNEIVDDFIDPNSNNKSSVDFDTFCPTIWPTPEITHDNQCKPDESLSIDVLSHVESGQKFIQWEKNPSPEFDYNRWGVTYHRITSYQNGVELGFIDQAIDVPFNLSEINTLATEYTVQACTGVMGDSEVTCGFKLESGPFVDGGMGLITTLNEEWTIGAPNEFKVRFSYNDIDFNTLFGKPDYFEVTPEINNTPTNVPIILNVGSDNLPVWETSYLSRSQYPENTFAIRACNNEIGCGVKTYVTIEDTVNDFKVYEDDTTYRRYITWDASNLSDVTHFVIGVYHGSSLTESYTVSSDEPSRLVIDDTTNPSSYSLTSCNSSECSGPVKDFGANGKFAIGLVKPIMAPDQPQWNESNTAFEINFVYPETPYNSEGGKPETFEIYSNFPQSDGTFYIGSIDESIPSNGNITEGWHTPELIRDQVIGSVFKILACSDKLGCSFSSSIMVGEPVVNSLAIPFPEFNTPIHDPNSKTITLSWDFDANDDLSLVDYIKIKEAQPRFEEGIALGRNSTLQGFESEIITHRIDEPLLLNRFTVGIHTYEIIASCQSIKGADDVCNVSGSDHFSVGVTTDDGVNSDSMGNIHAEWYKNTDNNKILKWSTSGVSVDVEIDYFLLRSFQYRGGSPGCEFNGSCEYGEKPFCITKQVSPEDEPDQMVTIDSLKIDSSLINGQLYSTEFVCDNLISVSDVPEQSTPGAENELGYWVIQACINGIGCGPVEPVDDVELSDIQNIVPATDQTNSPSSIGPELLKPGHFWNKALDGNGWNFFWVNGLSQTAQDGRYGKTYDLVGYWFTYRKDDENNWTPTWIEARLKSIHEVDGTNEVFYSGTLYSHQKVTENCENNATFCILEHEVGHLKLSVIPTVDPLVDNSRKATLILDLDYASGLFTSVPESENIHPYTTTNDGLMLEIEDFSILGFNGNFLPNNDADHYAGLWQDPGSISDEESPLSSSDISMLTWIKGGLENTTIAYFDEDGLPIWGTTLTMPGTDPEVFPIGGYFNNYESLESKTVYVVPHAYNPLAQMPLNWTVSDNLTTVGWIGRDFEHENVGSEKNRFNVAGLTLRITDFINNNTRDIRKAEGTFVNEDDSTVPQINVAGGYTDLIKRANLHGIFYDIAAIDNINVETCDPDATGPCEIYFSWYTDDQFTSIVPMYSFDGSDYDPLSDLCPAVLGLPSLYPEVIAFNCIIETPGDYIFQLHKPSYDSSGATIAIAESKKLTVDGCDSNQGCDFDSIPVPLTDIDDPIVDVTSMLMPTLMTHVDGSGPVPGSGGVSGGAATYHIPMNIPSGINGMTPELSINYSSKGGNGVMGMGWSVSVGSNISRCPSTFAQEGVYRAVDFSTNDKLCLSGQKLILKSGDYLIAGSEYRTEIDSFARISMTGNQFEVISKSGRINSYEQLGTTSNETTWYLTKEEDPYGNNIIYKYNTGTNTYGEDEFVITEILYTGDELEEGNRKIKFNYSTRADASQSYYYGKLTERTLKLDGIDIFLDTTLVSHYSFEYDASTATEKLLLQGIDETRGGISRTLAETFWSENNWNVEPNGGVETRMSYQNIMDEILIYFNHDRNSLPKNITNLTTSLDFNGDGIKELTYGPQNEKQSQTSGIVFLDQTGAVIKVLNKADAKYANKFGAGDINSDGINDLISLDINNDTNDFELIFYQYDIHQDINNPSHQFKTYFKANPINLGLKNDGSENFSLVNPGISWGIDTSIPVNFNKIHMDPEASEYYIRDIDNDGLDDIVILVQLEDEGNNWSNEDRWLIKNNLLVFKNTSSWNLVIPEHPEDPPIYIEFEIKFDSPEVLVPGLAPKFERDSEPGGINTYIYDKIESVEDFNGDGLIDVHVKRLAKFRPTWLSDVPVIPTIANEKIYFRGENGYPVAKNFSQLGLTGFMCRKKPSTSTGSSLDEPCDANSNTSSGFGPNSFNFQDVNGDGLKDLLYYDRGIRSLVGDELVVDENIYRNWKVRLNKGGNYNSALFDDTSIDSDLPVYESDEAMFLPQGNICLNLDPSLAEHDNLHRICNFVFRSSTKAADLNADGISELLFPNPEELAFNRCYLSPNVSSTSAVSGTGSTRGEPTGFVTDLCSIEVGDENNMLCQSNRDMSVLSAIEQSAFNPFVGEQEVLSIVNNQGIIFNDDEGFGCLGGNCTTVPEEPDSTVPNNVTNANSNNVSAICSRGDYLLGSRYDIYTQAGGLNALWDRGVYGYSALDFKVKNNELIVNETVDTGIYSTLFWGGGGDLTGDGLTDFQTPFGCFKEPHGAELLGCTEDDGTVLINDFDMEASDSLVSGGVNLMIKNNEIMPDMVLGIYQPQTDISFQWDYHSIATELDDSLREFPLYRLPERSSGNSVEDDGYINQVNGAGEYFYFNSSMYVVSEMRKFNGIYQLDATGEIDMLSENYSTTQYSYEEAVYNNRGRGFQGFRKIKAINKPIANSDFNMTMSVSVFNQVFPLAGTLESVHSYSMDDLSEFELNTETIYEYNDNLSSYGGVFFNPLESITSFQMEEGGELKTTQTQEFISYDSFGNVTEHSDVLVDNIKVSDTNDQVVTTTKHTSNTYNPVDNVNTWWIDKLNSSTVTSTIDENTSESSWLGQAFGYDASTVNKSVTSKFIWTDNSSRKLWCQYTIANGATAPATCNSDIPNENISRNSFIYDDYGNISQVKNSGWVRLVGGGTDVQDRITVTDYSYYEGYFPNKVTQTGPPFDLKTTFYYDETDGNLILKTDPNMINGMTFYDAFGVPTSHGISNTGYGSLEAATSSAMSYCGDGGQICAAAQLIVNEALESTKNKLNSKYDFSINTGFYLRGADVYVPKLYFVSQTRKPGSPMITNWHDNKGQVILSKTDHTGGSSYVMSLQNPLGQVELTTSPFLPKSTPYFTFDTYDERGLLFERFAFIGDLNGDGDDCYRKTMYTHDKGRTTINASYTGTDCTATEPETDNLMMSRIYDAQGKLRQTTDAKSYQTKYWYDASGNPHVITDAANNPIVTVFDDLGRKESVDDPNMGLKTFEYNSFGEVVFEQDDEQKQHTDQFGNPIDDVGNYTFYDQLGRNTVKYWNVTDTQEPLTNQLSYQDSYSHSGTCGSLTAVCDEFRYSNFNGAGTYINEFYTAQHKSYSYDAFGRMVHQEVVLTDVLGELSSLAYGDAEFSIEYDYYENYNFLKQTVYNRKDVQQISDSFFSVVNHYDIFGSLISQYEGATDLAGAKKLMQFSDYDFRGQPKYKELFGTDGHSAISEYSYYPNGQIKKINHGYNDNTNSGSQTFDYQYDAWGNISAQKLNGSIDEVFKYDELQRITSSTIDTTAITYEYDETGLGNLTLKSDYSSDQIYGENGKPNAITTATLSNGNVLNYQYDAKGNRDKDLITINSVTYDQASYVYDANNLLIRAVRNEDSVIHFRYGIDQQRYLKYEDSLELEVDSNEPLRNKEATIYAGPHYEEVVNLEYLNKEIKVQVSDYLSITLKGNNRIDQHFFQKDRLGSTTQILDHEMQSVKTMSYDVFGKPRDGDSWSKMDYPELDFNAGETLSEIDITKRGFTDHEHLDNFELIHMNGRMYDFNNGRFLSVDPFIQGTTSQAINPYSYIQNNPLSGTDPTGYKIVSESFDCDEYDCGALLSGAAPSHAKNNGVVGIAVVVEKKGDVSEILAIHEDGDIEERNVSDYSFFSATQRLLWLSENRPDLLDLQANAGPDMRVNQYIAHRMAEKNGTDFQTEYANLNVWGEINIDLTLDDFYQAGVGFGDAITFGGTKYLREWNFGYASVDGGVDYNSTGYITGEYLSFGIGGGRLAYAGAAKGYSMYSTSARSSVNFRDNLKAVFRLGVGRNWRAKSYEFFRYKKRLTDSQIIKSAGRTNPYFNLYGAGLILQGATDDD
ncbi:RHS repeat-associated core domain-containing protein [Marinicella litoralis]|uniref:RHS repeat-associated protein n=1 Tax=Marinicella litoralis TaxID=644220 RepID=A0A4V3DGJ7_9GAMM|nr:RHS repeat-associated core domain-containing protein [Marinicella litoralis]TDR14631.1 RHS repeat-associated protein [Marinicella litoralis]